MCIKVNVSFPVLNKFLMLYSLRSGTYLIMFWFAIRSFACIIFAMMTIPELFTGGKKAFKKYLLTAQVDSSATIEEIHYYIYGALGVFLMTEAVIFVHACYLANGLFCRDLNPVKNFLVCRLYTWLIEIFCLVMLCFIHKIILGWYLVMLMVFILEVYSVGVVYSYYCSEQMEESPSQKCCYPEWA